MGTSLPDQAVNSIKTSKGSCTLQETSPSPEALADLQEANDQLQRDGKALEVTVVRLQRQITTNQKEKERDEVETGLR